MKICRCCKFQFDKGKECPNCGFNMIQTFDDEAEREEQKLADEHRLQLLNSIENIEVVSYKYKVSVGKPDLSETNYTVIAQSGNDCYKQIVWSSEKFAPNPGRKKETRSLNVQYFVNGKKKDLTVDIPLENFDTLWSLGVMINEDFTIRFYLGDSDNYTQSESCRLKLK